MPNIDIGIYETLGRHLRVLYADILDQGVPDHLAAIVVLMDDPVNFAADSTVVMTARSPPHSRVGQITAAWSAMARSSG
jgi:Anti-sigma factor NepR